MPIFVFSGCFLLLLFCQAKRSETANWLKHQDQDLIDEMLTVYFKSFPQNSRNNPSNSVSLNRLKGKRLTSWFLAIPSLCLVKSRHRCQLSTRWINHFLTLLTKYFISIMKSKRAKRLELFGFFRRQRSESQMKIIRYSYTKNVKRIVVIDDIEWICCAFRVLC